MIHPPMRRPDASDSSNLQHSAAEEAILVRAKSMVLRAMMDLMSNNDRQATGAAVSERAMSQEWIFGEDVLGSFRSWCNLANLRPDALRRRARKLMASSAPELHWRPRALTDPSLPRVALAHAANA